MAIQPSQISSIPSKPGVYLMKDKDGKIIYVGKAKSLRKRVRSYFTPTLSPKNRLLSPKVESIDYIVTATEVDALVLEADLIKLHLPHYNIQLKDDKRYPYIKVTVQEDFPRVFPTRDLRDRECIYFGPYTSARTMKRALKSATEIFPVRTCGAKLPSRVCLAYHMKKCPAPCEGKLSKEDYQETITELIDFLSGKSREVEQRLRTKMQELSEKLEFEEAAKVRDRLTSVVSIVKKQRVVFKNPVDMDVFGLYRKNKGACIAVAILRGGRISGTEHYILKIRMQSTDAEIVRAFVVQYYKNAFYVPQQIVVQEIDERDIIEKWLNRTVHVPRRGEKLSLVKFATRNAETWLGSEADTSPQRRPKVLDELKKHLGLSRIPTRIEAFDISNIAGSYAVGSCVAFLNGRAQKSGYRRFRIKTVHGINDVAMMKEIVARRVKGQKLPDLVLVDGGISQVRAARACLPPEVPVFGLAKRFEQLYTHGNKVISLPRSSPALRLLQRIRDEAHRFAISYHKKLRDHPRSVLEEIPGIGEQRREALIRHFHSFERLRQASAKELEKVPGVGKVQARRVCEFLREL
jgi:excinuclease ABC subunit C